MRPSGDNETALSYYDRDVEFSQPADELGGGTYYGVDGVVDAFRKWLAPWDKSPHAGQGTYGCGCITTKPRHWLPAKQATIDGTSGTVIEPSSPPRELSLAADESPTTPGSHSTTSACAYGSGDTARAMSQENVERTQRGMSSADEFFGLLHDDVVFDNETYPLPDLTGTHHGKDAVIRVFKHYWRSFSDYSVELTEAIDADDQIVLVMRERATGEASGAVVERAFFAVWAFEDGKIVRIEGRATREDALEAVGLQG